MELMSVTFLKNENKNASGKANGIQGARMKISSVAEGALDLGISRASLWTRFALELPYRTCCH